MATTTSSSPPSGTKIHRRRILVGLDRSPFSEACVAHAVSLAKTFGSAITLVHVLQPHQEHGGPQMHDALSWEISRQEAQGYLERLGKSASAALGQPVDVALEQGQPAERLVDLAREIEADLTVLGSHGQGGITPWSLGNTVQQVLAVARNSVLIVHASSVAPREVALKRILIPLDGSLRSESVLPVAVQIASAHEAEILLVHVVQEPLPMELLRAADGLELAQTLAGRLEQAAKKYLSGLQQRLANEGASVRTRVLRHANQRGCLVEISRDEQADLVVLSAHGAACDAARSFGSVTTYLLTHAMAPLLVLQDLPDCELGATHTDSKPPPPLRAHYASESM